jgi:hypothetical protein
MPDIQVNLSLFGTQNFGRKNVTLLEKIPSVGNKRHGNNLICHNTPLKFLWEKTPPFSALLVAGKNGLLRAIPSHLRIIYNFFRDGGLKSSLLTREKTKWYEE